MSSNHLAQTVHVPRYRQDIAGRVAAVKAECTDAMRCEAENADFFVASLSDLAVTDDYRDFLTQAELLACFKKATGLSRELA